MKKRSDIDEFEKIDAQLDALHKEIGVLSKKKPEGGINPFKLKLANSVLEKANNILAEKYKPFSDFELFNSDDIPTNSDVVMVLLQYLNCMEKLRSDNIKVERMHGWKDKWTWSLTGVETGPPKKLK